MARGRRARPSDELMSERVKLCLRPAEADELCREAIRAGLSLNGYVRKRLGLPVAKQLPKRRKTLTQVEARS